MPKGFYFLIGAQFASGLADNALIVLGIYFLQEQGYPGWWAPMLKFSLTVSYVLLASVVGPVSDAFPKHQLMAWMNALKVAGIFLLLLGCQPLLAFAVVGLAASLYAPSKYGLVTEAVPSHLLVRANAWLESSMVLSVVLGIALGGGLTALAASHQALSFLPQDDLLQLPFVVTQTLPSMLILLGVYLLSGVMNLGLGRLQKRVVKVPLQFKTLHPHVFWKSSRQLWRDPLGGMSLYVTTLYWGVGAVMQFAVLLWAQQSLGLALQQGAYLQSLVAFGVIVGAIWAGRQFKLHSARQALPWGIGLAVLLPAIALISQVELAVPLLLAVGFSGGMLLVPMNALLQRRGMQVLSTGRSIAVQGFNENLSVLLMLAAYSAMLAFELPLLFIMVLLSVLLVAGMLPLLLLRWR
jgi:LPLT family lysophospholipid transporter-like MFS transporter